uniref:Remodeling and spacing factor 1 n=1 Tax=Molossus molossus TaxID=27622 RepID=A0A7J8EU61_MOLMO|nr:remodeling and spacing factor 1 [Molossus molossus]
MIWTVTATWMKKRVRMNSRSVMDLKMSLLYLMKTQMKVKKTHHLMTTVTLISVAED